ncbi:hypothetical protein Egran_02560 [Elaphomyces granulatus]|uniref:Uncharacterized protein n=1 Tax=Elaphomyces granulatus TaxID=519963 RepID=A0A232M059_9EURO|nr:hypothetical protein Egran_02560 [Elaphomyces granulatus]
MTTVNIQNGTIFMARDWLEYSSNPNLLAFSLDKAAVQEETADTHGGAHLLNGDQDILWIDKMKRVGLKVRVKRGRSNRPMPFVAAPHESLPLHYEVEIEEVRVRSVCLLCAFEESWREPNFNSKLIVMGAYRPDLFAEQ